MQPTSVTSVYSFSMARPQILCVDSDVPGLVLLDAVLSPRGFDVVRATGMQEALEILMRQNIDLILLGAILPGVDGFTVCLHLRSLDRFRELPIVMMSAIKSRDDFIRGIEAGADDFLFKPLDHDMMLARIKMLVERKKKHEVLDRMYQDTTSLTMFGAETTDGYKGGAVNIQADLEKMVRLLVRKTTDMIEKPRSVIVGYVMDGSNWQWHHYEYSFQELGRVKLDFSPVAGLDLKDKSIVRTMILTGMNAEPAAKLLIKNFQARNMSVENGIAYLSPDLCILAVNYGVDITDSHMVFLRQIIVQSRFLYLLSSQARNVEMAFDYGVYALARAAEAHDDDSGNHIYRVGDYCGVLAERLGMKEDFIHAISVQAILHDVGKIYTPQATLKKTDALTADEALEMRKHTLWGAKIIGGNPCLHIAQSIALNHHERWDGSGYPRGLRGEAIPIEARIAALADQYDTLRMARPNKPAVGHAAVTRMLNQGDGRIKPQHFDPQALKAYRETAFLFEEIFERRK